MEESLAPITRRDFERFAAEMREEVAAAVAASARSGGQDVLSDVLGQLRIIKWGAGFALAAIMGAFGILYQGQIDLRAEMRGEIAGLRAEMRGEIAGLRAEMRSGIAGLRDEMRTEIAGLGEEMRTEIAGLREEMRTEIAGLREEMRTEIAGLREEMHREFGVLRREIAGLGERVARLEAGQGFILTRLDDLVARVGALEASQGEDARGETPRPARDAAVAPRPS